MRSPGLKYKQINIVNLFDFGVIYREVLSMFFGQIFS